MVDKAKTPTNPNSDQQANTDFMNEMLGSRSYSVDEAAERLANSDGLLESIFGTVQDDEGEDDDQRAPSDDDGQGDEPADEEEDDLEDGDDDGQGDDHPDDESGDEDGQLFTLDDKGKRKTLGLDDIVVPFELDGEKQELSLADIAKELKDNRLRHGDYTRKTQDIARKVQDGVRQATEERQQQLDRGYERLNTVLAAFGGDLEKDVSFEELKTRFNGDAEQAGEALQRMQALKSQIKTASQEMEQHQARLRNDAITSTLSEARDFVPGWRDDRQFQSGIGELSRFASSEGLGEEDFAAILQKPAYLKLMLKALEGDKLTKKTTQKPRRTKKTIRIGSSKSGPAKTKQKPRRARNSSRTTQPNAFDGLEGKKAGLSQDEAEARIMRSLFPDT